MAFATKRDDIVNNIIVFEKYLTGKNDADKKFALNLLETEDLIVIYKVDGINHFAPCRFGAVKGTTKKTFEEADRNTIGEITTLYEKIVGFGFYNETTDGKFIEYAATIGLKLNVAKKRFWRLKDERGKNLDLKSAKM